MFVEWDITVYSARFSTDSSEAPEKGQSTTDLLIDICERSNLGAGTLKI
jgi:hypothetical protein